MELMAVAIIDLIAALVLATLTITITILARILATENPRYRSAFIVMGCVCVLCALWIGFRNYQSQTEAARSQVTLQKNLAEIGRVQGLNTKLQEQLIESNATIAGLAKQNIDEITGGDSFCYVEVREFALSGGLLQVYLSGKGKYAVSAEEIRIVDLDELDANPGSKAALGRQFSFPQPVRYTGSIKRLYDIKPPPEVVSKRFNIFIKARNGYFEGFVRLRRMNDGGWRVANRVRAGFLYHKERSGIVLEEIDRGFPPDILRSDHDWKATDKEKRVKVRE
jgi:hypothetical protein